MKTYKSQYKPLPGYSYIFRIKKKDGTFKDCEFEYLYTENNTYKFLIKNTENDEDNNGHISSVTPYRFDELYRHCRKCVKRGEVKATTAAEAESVEAKREEVRAATERAEENPTSDFTEQSERQEAEAANRQAIEELKNLSAAEVAEIEEHTRINAYDLATDLEVMFDNEKNFGHIPNPTEKIYLFAKHAQIATYIVNKKFALRRQAKAVLQ